MSVQLHHMDRAYELVSDRDRALSILECPDQHDGGYRMAAIHEAVKAIDPIEWFTAVQAAKRQWVRRVRREHGLCAECGGRMPCERCEEAVA